MDLRPSIFPTQGFEIKNAHPLKDSRYSCQNFQLTDLRFEISSHKSFPQNMKKSHEAKFQILFMEKFQ